MQQGFKGISFPFRVNSRGGIEMSSTSMTDASHIIEAVEQILQTRPRERCMEYHFKADLDLSVFEPNDVSSKCLVEHQIKEALTKLEDRIEVSGVSVSSDGSSIYADIRFRVIKYNTTYSGRVKVGEENATGD